MDYFKELITHVDGFINNEDYPLTQADIEVVKVFIEDIIKYRDFSIRHYNNDEQRATDKFCLNAFLNAYNLAIKVFGLHSELDRRKMFNRLIEYGWLLYNDKFSDII